MEQRERGFGGVTWMLAAAVIVASLGGCEPGGTLPQDETLITLEGTIVDPVLDDAGVADAWIVVDTGDELISVRSGADGGFSIPDVPEDRAISITVAAEDRRALTDGAVVLADEELPLEIGCAYRSSDYYDFPTMTISGTVEGAPVGSYLFFNGSDYWGEDYLPVESSAPVPFEIDVTVYGSDREVYTLAAMAIDGQSGEILGAAAAQIEVAASADVALQYSGGLADLTITTNQPVLDGVPLEALDSSDALANLSVVSAGEDSGAILGWADGWEAVSDGFEIAAWYAPVDGMPHHVSAYLTDDIYADGPFAYASVPLQAGAETLELDVLDSPALHDHGAFGPGTTLGWDAVEDATSYAVYVLEGDELAWWLLGDGPEVAFPRLPDDFDTAIIAGGGQWHVRATQYVEVDGEIDLEQPYLVSETPGGELAF